MKELVKALIGRILCRLMPEKHEYLRRNFTIPSVVGDNDYGVFERLMRSAILKQAWQEKNGTESIHQNFWRDQRPSQWYDQTADRFESIHEPIIFPFAELVTPLLRKKAIEQVVEFGCGNGAWMAHLKNHWPIEKFMGIDISKEQIELCRQNFPYMQFSASEILTWMETNSGDSTAYLTNCGVLEYLSQASVERLFELIASGGNNLLFLVEPLANDYDLATETDSRIYGVEYSYSHNYLFLLKRAGFEIFKQKEINILNTRMLIIIAV